jgi:hypothetical protein
VKQPEKIDETVKTSAGLLYSLRFTSGGAGALRSAARLQGVKLQVFYS